MEQIPTTAGSTAQPDQAVGIRQLNDLLRTECIGGQRMITRGIAVLLIETTKPIIQAVADYHDFDIGNDPHDEHDFGSLTVNDRHVLWKIDYYDVDLRHASPDPSNADITRRILTSCSPRSTDDERVSREGSQHFHLHQVDHDWSGVWRVEPNWIESDVDTPDRNSFSKRTKPAPGCLIRLFAAPVAEFGVRYQSWMPQVSRRS